MPSGSPRTVSRSAARTPVSSTSNRCNRRDSSDSSALIASSDHPGWSARRAAATRSANGSPPHSSASPRAAASSAATRSGPSTAASSAVLSAGSNTSTGTGRAASEAIRPCSRFRLVTTVTQRAPPGSNSLACAESRALSSTTRSCRSAVRQRNSAEAACADSGTCRGATCNANRKSRNTSRCAGSRVSLKPRRSA